MRGMLHDEEGFTLIEVLLASVLMLVVLGATLSTLTAFERNVKTNDLQNQAQEEARRGMDLMTRDLRNLASPTRELPKAVDKNGAQDLIFQSEGKHKDLDSLNEQNTTRVRYCVSATNPELYRQIQTWKSKDPPPVAASLACPGPTAPGAWNTTILVASNVVNGARPVFTYNSATLTEITEISSVLFVDTNPGVRPGEVTLQSSVYLRNQNRAPTAEFSWAAAPSAGNVHNIFLNASGSLDPEERPLTFHWYDASLTTCAVAPAIGPPPEGKPGCAIGDGIVLTYTPPAAGRRNIYLIVQDAALDTEPLTREVCAPGTGVLC